MLIGGFIFSHDQLGSGDTPKTRMDDLFFYGDLWMGLGGAWDDLSMRSLARWVCWVRGHVPQATPMLFTRTHGESVYGCTRCGARFLIRTQRWIHGM